MKRILRVAGALVVGVLVYYVLMGLLVYLVTDLLKISVSPADGYLLVLVLLKLIPLICAMIVFALVLRAGRNTPSGSPASGSAPQNHPND